ncbi:hypothetical protein GQR58_021110 [Nymphon striatum]|nr:hypothetical protein GQR58_021110 [Nymphon striatum]
MAAVLRTSLAVGRYARKGSSAKLCINGTPSLGISDHYKKQLLGCNYLSSLSAINILSKYPWYKSSYSTIKPIHTTSQLQEEIIEYSLFEDVEIPNVSFTEFAFDMIKNYGDKICAKGESAALMEEVMKCLESLESLWGDFESGLGVTARLWSMYIDMMLILRRYIHAERAGLWQQHLQEVRNMLPYTIASGHSKYMSCLPIYLNEMQKLPETAPEVHEEFASGKFIVHQTAGDFNGVWTDLAMAFIQRFNTLGSSTFGQLQERYRDKLLNIPRHCPYPYPYPDIALKCISWAINMILS